MFATSSADGIAQLTRVPAGPTTQLLGSQSGSTNALAFSPKGDYLATGQGLLWELASGQRLTIGTTGALNFIAFTTNNRIVASGNRGAYLVDWNTRRVLARLSEGEVIRTMAIGRDGDWIAVRVGDTLRLFRMRTPGQAPAGDADLESQACALAGSIEPAALAILMVTEPVLGCQQRE
jgi:WD40 repeat protein